MRLGGIELDGCFCGRLMGPTRAGMDAVEHDSCSKRALGASPQAERCPHDAGERFQLRSLLCHVTQAARPTPAPYADNSSGTGAGWVSSGFTLGIIL